MKNSLSKKNIYLKNVSEYLVLWAVGGCIYYGIEVLFRGFSHTSMFVLGGLCMQFFYMAGAADRMAGHSAKTDLHVCTIFCCEYGILSLELLLTNGIIWQFWDYSDMPLQLWGQILPSFCAYFFFFMYYGYPSVRISASLVL